MRQEEPEDPEDEPWAGMDIHGEEATKDDTPGIRALDGTIKDVDDMVKGLSHNRHVPL